MYGDELPGCDWNLVWAHKKFDGFGQCFGGSFLLKYDMDSRLFNAKSIQEGVSIGWLTWVTVIFCL